MRCKICGAELKKEGDICKNCYNEYVKEEKIKDDLQSGKNVILKLHRKYIPMYQLTRYGDYYVLALIMIIAFAAQKQYLWLILSVIIMIALLWAVLAYNKRKAINTTCTFFEDRIVWKNKDTIKSLEYSNLDDITYFQNKAQKRYNLADVQFRPIKGTYIMKGFELVNVPDFANTWKKICDIVNLKKEED